MTARQEDLDHARVHTWRHSRGTVFASLLLALFLGAVVAFDGEPGALRLYSGLTISLAALLIVARFVIHPRVRLNEHDLVIVSWRHRVHIPLVDIETAVSGYYGLEIKRTGRRAVSTWVLGTPNYLRMLGRTSRGDYVARHIERRAAQARGDEPPPIPEPRRPRSSGNLSGALGVVLAALFSR